MLTSDLNRGSTEPVARENAGDAGTFVQQNHRQVLSARLSDPSLCDTKTNAGHRMQFD